MAALPRLSVVMFTGGPTRLAAAVLRQVRPVAHEIVVAVDSRVPVDDIGPIEQVADRVIRAEFMVPLEANLDWLHRQATGDWVLRLDTDDVVSEALLRKLATPGWDEGITHAYVQYRWLWGGPDQMLAQAPWWPDPALRLIRNIRGIAQFPHGDHQVAEVAGAARLWDEPIYHLDMLVQSPQRRAAKAMTYEQRTPGLRTDRGWSVSSTYYRPENLTPPPRTAPLPSVDAAVVNQVLTSFASVAPLAPPSDAVIAAEVVTASDRAPAAPTPGDCRVRFVGTEPLHLVEGRSAVVTVGVTNVSAQPWRPAEDPANAVGGRFRTDSGDQVGFEVRASLPGPALVGEETLVRLPIPPGVDPAATMLDIGVVQDGVAWHEATVRLPIRHHRGRRVLVSTGISSFPHLGDDLITRQVLEALATELPDVVPVLLAHPLDSIAQRFGCEAVPGPAALPAPPSRTAKDGRRSRDLVAQARLMARGELPADPLIVEILAPFADASALVLAPGGGLATRYSDDALMVCAVEALVARAFGLPVFLEGPSVGPLEMRRDHAALAELLNGATRITVRDRSSAETARRIGRGITIEVVPDPATAALDHVDAGRAAAADWLAAQGVTPGSRYGVVSLRAATSDAANLATVVAAADALPAETPVVFLPHCVGDVVHDDRTLLADPALGDRCIVWDPALGDRAAVGLVAGATLAIGTRFHLHVLAAAGGVRSVALVADDYDRLRIRSLKGTDGLRVVELTDPAGAKAAAAELLASADPPSIDRWDPAAFARALDASLPAAPPLA